MLTITCDKRWFGHQKETKRFHGKNGNRSFTRSPVSKRFCEREPSEMLANAFDWWKWWAFLLVASIHTELPWEYQRNALLNVFMNYAENKNENNKKVANDLMWMWFVWYLHAFVQQHVNCVILLSNLCVTICLPFRFRTCWDWSWDHCGGFIFRIIVLRGERFNGGSSGCRSCRCCCGRCCS